jgi:FKBP-type peptidyl-prolyl cis-trans isomerase FkpA
MFRKIFVLSVLLVFAVACTKEKGVDFSAIDKQIIEDYLEVHNLTAQSTPSGLYYIISAPGESVHPAINSSVSAKYKGYLADGKVFDQTTTSPVTFSLGQVIKGWQEGLQLIGAGGKIKLLIPSALGYGDQVVGTIPRNSVLIFDVELVSVISNK